MADMEKMISLWYVESKTDLEAITAKLVKDEVWFDFRVMERGKKWKLIFRSDYSLPVKLAKCLKPPPETTQRK